MKHKLEGHILSGLSPPGETSHLLTRSDSQVAPEFHVPQNPKVLSL